MNRLFNIEWIKIYNYKTTRVFTLIYFAMLVVFGLILSVIKPEIGGVKLDIAKLGFFNFPEIWQNIGYGVSILKIFIAVIIITNMTNEYSNGTLKQNLIDGLSKKEFLGSKIMTNFLLASLSSVFVLGICLVLGFVFSTSEASFWEGSGYLLAYFLKLNLFFSICLFLAILLKKSAFAFLGLILLWVVETVVSTVEVLLRAYFGKGLGQIDPDTFYLSNYLPLNASSNLIAFPVNFEGMITGGSLFVLKDINLSMVVAAVIYILIFSYLSYRLLAKRDL
ncbi:MAG TPA: ABC transporter permease [Moheibacter sp.]|nr:ABC transporter permease [Moheibacter sp.]